MELVAVMNEMDLDLETAVRVLRSVGELARKLREERNLEQRHMAARIGLSYYEYRALEIGRPAYELADALEAIAQQRRMLPKRYSQLTEEHRRKMVDMNPWDIHREFGCAYVTASVWRRNAWKEFGEPEVVNRKQWERRY